MPSDKIKEFYQWKGEPVFDHGNHVDDGRPTVVELFCGCGGTSLGFELAGYNILLGSDFNTMAIKTFKANHPNATTVLGDISKVSTDDVIKDLDGMHVDVLIGGICCQGFSINNMKRHIDDKRNFMYLEVVRFVKALHPRYVVLENVLGMKNFNGFPEMICESLVEAGMKYATYRELHAVDYGVPQNRKRLIFVATNDREFDFETIVKTHGEGTGFPYNTVYDAISDLPHLNAREEATEYTSEPLTLYQRMMRAGSAELRDHKAARHPQSVIDAINDTDNGRSIYDKYHASKRLRWDEPAPTITCGGEMPSEHFFHPSDARGITVRERCRLQSFPDTFIIEGGMVQGRVQTGNAVPPLLAKAVAEALLRHMA